MGGVALGVQLGALLMRGFATSVPGIVLGAVVLIAKLRSNGFRHRG
jgi:hypothetical protein